VAERFPEGLQHLEAASRCLSNERLNCQWAPLNAKGLRGCHSPHPSAADFVHSLLGWRVEPVSLTRGCEYFGEVDRAACLAVAAEPAVELELTAWIARYHERRIGPRE
jgi:hypothetical protein